MRSYQKLRTSVPQLVLSQEEEEEENSTNPTAAGRSKLAPWWVGSGLLITAVLLSTITVWVLRQVSRGWHGPAPPSQCHLVPESHRYDCYPERSVVVTQELCESRGCCFIETLPAVGGKRGVPWCFYPPNFPSYVVQSLNQTALGMTGLLVRREKAYYPKDIQVLRMDVEFQTNTRLRIKITDAAKPRYEVPLEVPRVMKRAENPIYSLEFSQDPFGVLLRRQGTGTVLLNTTVAPLIFADQFLQISTTLPSRFLYGLGEHRSTLLHSLDWNTLTLWARDVAPTESFNLYGAHPFYLLMEEGGDAHGVFLLNSNAMEVALQPAPGLTWRTIGGVLDFYIFLGPDPNMVIQQYQEVIGFPAMPPLWALGFHLCRWGYGSSNETWQTARAMRNYQIPQDAQWNDIDYMDGYRDFTFDPQKFASLPSLVEDLHKHGQHYVMILDPGISSTSPRGSYWPFDEGLRRGLFLNTTQGQPLIGQVWPGYTAFPDFSNTDTHQWWLENLQRFHTHVPFDGLWIDMNEPSNFMDGSEEGCPPGELDSPPYTPAVLGNSLSAKTVCASAKQNASVHYNLHNLYGLKEAEATASALIQIRGKRPLVISRSTFPSQGRYSGHWLGDNRSQWKDMYYSIPGMLSFSLFGIPLVGADICGFSGSTSEELCTRWMQLGAFYPFSRNHNTQNEKAQDPTAFSPSARTAMKDVLLTRYSLLPFLYTLFHRAHLQGETVARPLFFEFPWDVATYGLDRQFLWGQSLLVTPVLEPGADSVLGYFPQGVWYDFYTGSSVNSSGEMLKLSAPLDHLNLHLREGSILPTQKPGTTSKATRGNPLLLIVALSPRATAWGDLFWDDGESLDTFERGNYSYLVFNATENIFTSNVLHASTEANYVTVDTVRFYGVQEPPSKVLLDGQEKPFFYLDNQVLTVSGLGLGLSQGFTLQWL
ncbi:lysosomal alpha-glucosidase-like [Tympanuchus pallidicinctus]|uniref:lysosomal alpha-glucosidase-like n=1 Tax=Tympanuchus pallidicinctus TaxID=109042 RepID=UPI0022875328|nr:lysosomal alpha-glucosidase-like [Tympanuchus pallidicinctus]XP_052536274.1 lysosomal alpha-glucosidase-like [Tympanuchus pallidicinctus]XP_052536275.1 lysosomal alpha-glucosidase-like [Tympanuchus pallidicinctus]XP_052536276.1 lysosomal alpha-glucosidase-like [Tympanuchus pallidicinctus]